MRRRYSLLVLLSILACLFGCGGQEVESEPVIRPVRYQQVYSGAASRERSFSGTAQASVESKLSFKVGGTLLRLSVAMGDRVQAGENLAEIDAQDYELRVQQTAASYEQALAQQRNAAADYRRTLALYENNNASRDDLDAARAAKESADAQVRSLQNSLELARLQLSYTRIEAPVDGDVAAVPVEINENVSAGQTVVILMAGTQPEVVVGVPEAVITQIREGDPVSVTFDAIGGRRFSGTVTEVAIMPGSASSTFEVRARLDQSDADIRSGMACEVTFRFDAASTSDHFLVPPISVQEDRTGRFVYVVQVGEGDLGITHRRAVEVGELRSNGLEILSGIEEGDLVVTAGVSKISDGMTVRLQAQ